MPRMRQPNEGDRKTGLVCRKCGCQHFITIWVGHRPDGMVIRKKECRYCGKPITTKEEAVEG